MNEKLKKDENVIVDLTRNSVSRHQVIPPTPRDTMAVIMQAAEKEAEKKSAFVLTLPVFRWATMAAILAVLLFGWGYFHRVNKPDGPMDIAAESSPVEDLGLDVAAWDMEIESLLDDLDESFAALTYDDYTVINF